MSEMFRPLVNSLTESSKVIGKTFLAGSYALTDVIVNALDAPIVLYKLATGKYKNEDDFKKELEINNKVKYKYIPLDDLEKSFVDTKFLKYEYIEGDKEGVKACVGCNLEGEPKYFNMLDGHALIGGASRWGKSSFLNTFITYILLTYTEKEVAFMGCDFKRSDIYYFRRYKHFRETVATKKEEFMQHMNKLEKEMNKRSEILDKSNCRNVINYNKKFNKKMSYIIYVIDELPLLTKDKDCCDRLRLIMGQCASYGIYFILATQDATKESIGKCKMNCSQIVGFHTKDETDSKTLINSDILKDIKYKGRCFIDSGDKLEETQIFYIEEDEIEDLLKGKLKEQYKAKQEV